jgi:hypothetical protein
MDHSSSSWLRILPFLHVGIGIQEPRVVFLHHDLVAFDGAGSTHLPHTVVQVHLELLDNFCDVGPFDV